MSEDCGNTQFAYILDHIDGSLTKIISINDYLSKREELKDKLLVCKNKHRLIACECTIKQSYFRHYKENLMSNWHKNWQKLFEHTEITIGHNRADAVVGNNILEFQYSHISKNDVKNRYDNSLKHNKELYWVIECNNSVSITEIGDKFLLEFYADYWKYENFKCHNFIFLNIDNKLFKINPNDVKSHMIDVSEYKLDYEFTTAIQNNVNIWNDEEIHQCSLYWNQMGAGCGKTYKSIQLLETSEEFKHKDTFIYLTKAHSAKEVIYNELKDQYQQGKLQSLSITNEEERKQYKIEYIKINSEKQYTIIIGTIDSFTYSIGDKTAKGNDYFSEIVKSIKNGHIDASDSGLIKYAQTNITLNKNCLIIIDEAQDLPPIYIEAMYSIMRNNYIDIYLIGDKLQSIYGDDNIYTFLENKIHELPNINIYKSNGVNHVMRFHNNQFKDFVNNLIDFDKYNLPKIAQICNGECCKYVHEDDIQPYTIFLSTHSFYNTEENLKKIDTIINSIILHMTQEIVKYKYLPNNFMFIFPILTKNLLASRLESKLQNFWIDIFNCKGYQKHVLKKNKYWRNKINDKKYYQYVFLHKSEENKPIDLKESENATRILSIHASKGNGCECVFLLGLTESALSLLSRQKYEKDGENLVYDSLLHVAITRQKKTLYIGIEENNDEIYKLFKEQIKFEENKLIQPNAYLSTSNKISDVVDYIINSKFETILEFIEKNNYENKLPQLEENRPLVDWGHHIIRMSIFEYYIMYSIINNEDFDDDSKSHDQFLTILSKVSDLNILPKLYVEYCKILNDISKKLKKFEIITTIPILKFAYSDNSQYYEYNNLILKIIKNIQKKIKLNKKQVPDLDPLECIIYCHIRNIYGSGKFTEISIMDIYNILHNYNKSNKFIAISDLKQFQDNITKITEHFEKTKIIKNIYDNYKKYISEQFGDSKFIYNIDHCIKYNGKNNDFKTYGTKYMIAYSDKEVINFILVPQFNKLNFYKIIVKGLIETYILSNPIEKDGHRYKNKDIYTCIMSLDSEDPIFYKFDIDQELINSLIKDFLYEKYSVEHKRIYNLYNWCRYNKEKGYTGLLYTIKCLEDINNGSNYIIDFLKKIQYLSKEEIKLILISEHSEELFIKKLDEHLINSIEIYLGYNKDECVEY
jgi:hypothetical protein